MSKIEVDAIDKQSGSTLTLGGSGTAVTLGAGATQTGFGRSGSVNWVTTKKTTSFTAVNGEGYFVDTAGGVVTVTLPASPSAGDIVYVKDYDGNFGTTSCIIARNSSNIRGATDNITLNNNNAGVVCIYVDATEGWQLFFDGSDADAQATFISATGGTVTTVNCGSCKVHTFTGPGTFTVCSVSTTDINNCVSYSIVAGGGGGGGGYQGGGGGAGGFREVKSPSTPYTASPLDGYGTPANRVTVTAQGYPIVVGGGGPGGAAASPNPSGNRGTDGVNSSALGFTSAGGGSGGAFTNSATPANEIGNPGGSGGGAGRINGTRAGGTGNTPSVTPAQGTNGGGTTTPYASPYNGGGGGGATSPGGPGQASCFGVGGNGASTEITASAVIRAGGGGSGGCGPASTAGNGGAGTGGSPSGGNATNATANTGSGGGGGQINPAIPSSAGGNGGSGIVIIRYKIA